MLAAFMHGINADVTHQQALCYSHSATPTHRAADRHIYESTIGVLFFGTPHLGAKLAKLQQSLLSLFNFVMKVNKIGRVLQTRSQQLRALEERYLPISNDFATVYFYEEYPTPIVGWWEELVRCSSVHFRGSD
jgi:hypothetical protein